MSDLIARARASAIGAHARINQLRKYTQQPYDVHLKAVAELVAAVSDDAAMTAAASLHDTVEDTPATFEDLEALRNNLAHGQDVASHDWPQIVRLARRIQQMYGNESGRST